MPNLVAYNSGSTISNALQFGTIVMDVNNTVNLGSLLWCPDYGICNQYIIITDSYTNGKTNQLNSRAMGFQTSGLTNSDLIDGINKLAASKFAGPFGTLQDAITWAISEGYFITNQEYPTIVTSGCVLNLDSNFPASYPLVFDTWYDLTGNGNTGLLNNSITYNSALRGSLVLNGTDQYISFSATTNIPVGNSNYTIGVWFNADTLGDKGLVGWGNYGTANEVNAFRLTSNGLTNYWWGNDLAVVTTITPGNWYYAVATFDGTTRSIYVDGSLIGSDTPTGHNVTTSSNLTIGLTNTTEYFDGNMGEVQIFDRALSSTEIAQNYNALLPRYNGTYTDPCDIAPLCSPTPNPTPNPTPTPTPTGTPSPACNNYNIEGAPSIDVEWLECDGTTNSATVTTGILICAQTGSVYQTGGAGNITQLSSCLPTPTPTQTSTPTPTSGGITCIQIVDTVINPVPQTGVNNFFGVNVALNPYPVSENVTVTGYIRDDGNISNTYDFSITIIGGTQSGETANNVLMTGPADTATIFVTGVTPTTVTYNSNSIYICGFEPTITPTPTATPTSTLVPSLGCSGGTISGTYSGNNQYTYPNQPVSSIVDSYINFSWGSIDRPNRFTVYDSTGLLWTSGWVGFADYAGPWGPSLNTPSTGNSTICFLSPSGRYVLVEAGNASPITPITDAYEYTLTCLGSCPGGVTSTPTPTPSTTPAGIQATIEFSFYDSGSGVIRASMEVIGGVTLDSLSWAGTGIGYSALGCSGTENIQAFNDILGIGDTQITTEVWGSISAILSAQNQTSSFSVNGNTINVVSQIITVGGHNYVITGVTDCFSPL
jgi:hypothetical protein